jgi:geranylgeranyl pyrophosphate synthase
MRQFGYNIGMAFQIVDDVLDFTGEQATVGKPVASDLRQGLITLPALYFLEAHPGDPDMEAVLGDGRYNDALMTRLVAAIRKSGAIEQSMDEARGFVRRGLKILKAMPDNVERHALAGLAEYLVSRDL